MNIIHFWEKPALRPSKNQEDFMNYFKVDPSPKIREVIRNLEGKILKKRLDLLEVPFKNSSVKDLILSLFKCYPERCDDKAQYIIDAFRAELYPRSKEKEKFIVGLLQLNDIIVIAGSVSCTS